jgi:hypothetical protein
MTNLPESTSTFLEDLAYIKGVKNLKGLYFPQVYLAPGLIAKLQPASNT